MISTFRISKEARAAFEDAINIASDLREFVRLVRKEFMFGLGDIIHLYQEYKTLDSSELAVIQNEYCHILKIPEPNYTINDSVSVEKTGKGIIECKIIDVVWHHKLERWFYFLQIKGGKKLSRRYTEEDFK
jgi:hypothetical protein